MRVCVQTILLVFVANLAGCMVGPNYRRPAVQLPPEWRHQQETLHEDLCEQACWWTAFNDPTLNTLVAESLDQNLSLREAALRVAQTRYQRCIVRGELFPQIDAEAGYLFQKTPTTGGLTGQLLGGGDDGGMGGGMTPTVGFDSTFDQYSLGFNGTWEIDIFGRLRRNLQAARAEVSASVWSYRDTMVLLLAEVATNYTDARAFQERLRIARQNLESQERSLEITRQRFEAELINELDVAQARANVEATRAEIPTLEAGFQQAVNRLSTLVGRPPGYIDDRMNEPVSIPNSEGEIALGIPAELLRRRPDIRQAEYNLLAQVARLGAAEADMYPSLSLSGAFGVQSQEIDTLFTEEAINANIGPTLRWNLLNYGRVRCNIQLQDSIAAENVAAYQRTILEASEEVDNALVNYTREQQRLAALRDGVTALRRAVDLSTSQYQRGTVDFQRVLDSQRSLLQSEDQLASSRANVTRYLIELYRALGGGWDCPTHNAAPVPTEEVSEPTQPEPVPTPAENPVSENTESPALHLPTSVRGDGEN